MNANLAYFSQLDGLVFKLYLNTYWVQFSLIITWHPVLEQD